MGCHTWSQLKAQQSLLLNSTFNTTSWNYIFSPQDGFGVENGCVGWCLEKNKSSKVCFHKCKLILPRIQSIEIRFFFHIVFTISGASKSHKRLRISLSRNIRFVGVNISMSARNRHFQTNYWCITIYVKLRVAHVPGTFLRLRLQRKQLRSDHGMHHGTYVSHVPWCRSGSLARGGKNFPHAQPAFLRIWQEVHCGECPYLPAAGRSFDKTLWQSFWLHNDVITDSYVCWA